MFNLKYLQIDCIPNTLSPRPIARIPHRTFFPRLRVSHYPQFIKAANSGVVTACVLLKVQFVTACVLLKVLFVTACVLLKVLFVTAFVLLKVQFANLGVDVEYSSGER